MCKRAHSAVVYLCVESGTQRASQPGHIQRMNHPRLELMGPLMAARLVRILFSTLNLTVVLLVRQLCVHCLGAFTGGTMETFRTESQSSLCPQLWHLAEIPSWWHRPDWLADPACEWPCTKCKSGDSPSVLDERRSFHVVAVIAAPTEAE
ncbi:hypothetical protein T4B_6737 [Trichinella pseudospiralis]|uniref:Uncharacterized protein n=1 Tax=Trichinella pseudospiralis TaxID=6337 RepID=A0A0V1K880_TRIPS|nr:hypothetical protein T4B_6737 [Trichinella pseudospiralis]KRZ43396.1 hypothetical protein T4C_7284 [Trichinella pseudospiralis]